MPAIEPPSSSHLKEADKFNGIILLKLAFVSKSAYEVKK